MGSGICICIPPPQIILLWVAQELPSVDHCVRRAWDMGEGWFVVYAANTPTVASVSLHVMQLNSELRKDVQEHTTT